MSRRHICDCQLPWFWLNIDLDGNARPCCFATKYVGNVRENTVDEVWNGSEMVRLRGAIRDGYIDPICRNSGCEYVTDTKNAFGLAAYDIGCDVNVEVDLREGGRHQHCITGWATPDPPGVWSICEKATLAFELPEIPATDFRMEVLCRGIGHVEFPRSHVRVDVNDRECARWEFVYPVSTDYSAWRTMDIPIDVLASKVFEVCFVSEKLLSPINWGWPDGRELGILLSAVRIVTQ